MDVSEALNKLQIGNSVPKNVENFAAVINNNHTEFIIAHFQNNSTYIITQFGKIGNLYTVETEQVENGIIDTDPVYNLRSMLGAENVEVDVAVRYLAEQLKTRKLLTICLTLKDYKLETLKAVIQAIKLQS